MKLPPEQVNEFIKRYEEYFHEPLSYEEAEIMFRRLIELYRAMLDQKRSQNPPPQTDESE